MPGIIPLHVGVLVLIGKSPGVNSFFFLTEKTEKHCFSAVFSLYFCFSLKSHFKLGDLILNCFISTLSTQ